jgi:hypothetical protein
MVMIPAQSTEASCLLQSGALYHHRVGLVPASGHADMVFAGVKKGAFSLYFGDAPIYHFDLEGRWQRAFVDSTHYLKSLDTTVWAIDRVREGPNLVLRRRSLAEDEVRDLDLQIRGIALGMICELEQGRVGRQEPPQGRGRSLGNDELRDCLTRIAAWDEGAWQAHRTRYHATYGPLPFLTPECQNAVVVQATRGHAGGVGFAGGPVTRNSICTPEEFEEHVKNVVQLLGRRLLQTRLAFLAGSDVLRRPADEMIENLEILGRHFEIIPKQKGRAAPLVDDKAHLEGVHTFLDDFSLPRPGPESLRAYRQRHLAHVGLGVESGDPEVRGTYGKRWSNDDLRDWVADLRSADIGFSILTLVGAGGKRWSEAHLSGSFELFSSLGLGRGDTIFLLDEREIRDPASAAEQVEALSSSDWDRQLDRIKQGLAPLREQGVKVLPYSLEKQWA